MKLKDFLVQELPKRGGWPKDVKHIEMFMDGSIYFDGNLAPRGFSLPQCSDGWASGMPSNYENKVTREQYEAALAAAQQPVWNGEGLPPVGCECEVRRGVNEWGAIKVLAITGEYLVAKIGTKEIVFHLEQSAFRPIRSEADKKREEGILALAKAGGALNFKYGEKLGDSERLAGEAWYELYDKIASGEVKGVKLDV